MMKRSTPSAHVHAIDRVFRLPAETKERVGGPYRAAPGCTREEVRGRVRAGIYAP